MKAHKQDKKRYRRNLASFNQRLAELDSRYYKVLAELHHERVKLFAFEGLFLGLLHHLASIQATSTHSTINLLQTLDLEHVVDRQGEDFAAAALYRTLRNNKSEYEWRYKQLKIFMDLLDKRGEEANTWRQGQNRGFSGLAQMLSDTNFPTSRF